MKFTLVLALLAPFVAVLPAAEGSDAEVSANPAADVEASLVCADGLCIGINKNQFCNDRVRLSPRPLPLSFSLSPLSSLHQDLRLNMQ
jgi:hypothetical protein